MSSSKLKSKKDSVRAHILKYYGSILGPHERKLKSDYKIPQFKPTPKI